MLIEQKGHYTITTNHLNYEVAVSGIIIAVCSSKRAARGIVRLASDYDQTKKASK